MLKHTLHYADYSSWTASEVVSLYMHLKQGTRKNRHHLAFLYFLGCDGTLVDAIVTSSKKDAPSIFVSLSGYSHSMLTMEQKKLFFLFVTWIQSHFKPEGMSGSVTVEVETFEVIDLLYGITQTLGEDFKKSIHDWNAKISEQETLQKGILKELYKQPLLPDSFSSFKHTYQSWTGNFDENRIPENKGEALRNALSIECEVGRGAFGYKIIPFIDLSTSGKTFTVFNLAYSKPPGNLYDKFFVFYLIKESQLFETFTNCIGEGCLSVNTAVITYALANHLILKYLLDNNPELDPVEFLK